MPTKRKGEEYPLRSGIIITPNTSLNCPRSWRVDISAKKTGHKREQRQFSTKEGARTYSAARWSEIQQVGQQAFTLTAAQRADAALAFRLLAGSGLTLAGAVGIALKHSKYTAVQISVEELRQRFLASPGRRGQKLVERRHSSLVDARTRTEVFQRKHGAIMVDEITPGAIRQWLTEMDGLSPTSRNNYRRAVHAMFAFAVAEGLRSDNPVSKIPSYSAAKPEPAILSIAEATRLMNAAASNSELGLMAFVTLGLFAGLRRAELEKLNWSAVKYDRRMVTVSAEIAKTGSIRNVALTPCAIEWLERCADRQATIAPPGLDKRLRKLRALAGITDWHGNELRHSFASYHFDLHQNAPLTAAMLGHNSGTQLLFEHYRSLVPLGDGERYFGIKPADKPQTQLVEVALQASA